MKTISISKVIVFLLMLSIAINFIAISGIGNVYLSTVLVLLIFLLLIFTTGAEVLKKINPLLALGLFAFLVVTTVINVLFDGGAMAKNQTIFSVLYLQNILVFIMMYHISERISLQYFFKLFLWVLFLATIRVWIEEPERVFLLSSLRAYRIEALFIGAINNFALLAGIAFLISFFHIKEKMLRLLLCVFWLAVIVLTMSRGALLGAILTLFVVAFYDRDRKTLKALLKFSGALVLIGIVTLVYFDKIDFIIAQFQERFLSVFSDDTDVAKFSSGRGVIWGDVWNRITNSSFYEILFGHGVGSIDFKIKGGGVYESSHNIYLDILYRNGLFIGLLYLLMIAYITWKFWKRRTKDKLALFGIFVFLHLEIFVNPFPFAAQTGWLYGLFLVLFIKQDRITIIKNNADGESP